MKVIELIPVLDACDFSSDIKDELASCEVSTHYQSDIVCIDWDNSFPLLEEWIIETYGNDTKQYSKFAIRAT